jgi:hypothetical protein
MDSYPTVEQYKQHLNSFNWDYDQIDSYEEWKAHFAFHWELQKWSKLSDSHKALWQFYTSRRIPVDVTYKQVS